MFTKVLVANRGEISCRIIKTLRQMGITSVAIYSEADAHARHVLEADEAYCVGPAPASESYLAVETILGIAQEAQVEAIHPGYGFLSENSEFASRCEAKGIRFIGPKPSHLVDFGLKHRARELAEMFEVPLLPGSGLLQSLSEARSEASRIGYPVMLKSSGGGGGIGMAICTDENELAELYEKIKELSNKNFKDSGLFLEKYISQARHIEVQIFGDGNTITVLGDRECSVQRRNQKVIEEAPAPNLLQQTRKELYEAAKRLAEGVSYQSAGTVEFVVDGETEQFYFLEVNTRLQVEHCVTEEVFGVDLVEWMVLQAAGESIDYSVASLKPQGSAIEARIYAEDPGKNFQPSTGLLTEVQFPEDVRCDSWLSRGTEISGYYDPLLAKLIVHGKSRGEAVEKLQSGLTHTKLSGVETNLLLLRQILELESFQQGKYTTGLLKDFSYRAATVEVLSPGMQTTIQDYPGRIGYWAVGVPPSGPMDNLNHQLANRVVGNDADAAVLEITVSGPELLFNSDTVIALTGSNLAATLDGEPIRQYSPVAVKRGAILKTGSGAVGQRAYLAIGGGIEVPHYMGSRATFILGEFGGHGGRALRPGDILHLGNDQKEEPITIPKENWPEFAEEYQIGVLYGPHGAPDFFTQNDIETFFEASWEVHYNSSRTGVRLIGPAPEWARPDGGEAGLHPSNIHDNAYAIGTIDFTGDMPVILGPDGPSLGGFVCPVTIVSAELWKMGQLRPGNKVRFIRLSQHQAEELEKEQKNYLADPVGTCPVSLTNLKQQHTIDDEPVIKRLAGDDSHPELVYRRAGDKYLLVEYGELVLDLQLRFRVHALMLQLEKMAIEGIIDLTPGIRSLQIHYDNDLLPLPTLIELLEEAETRLTDEKDQPVEARIVHLPLSWDDPATHLAIEKYTQSVRPDAPWCPSNIEFIRRINGLDSIDEVKDILFNASYLVMGLGDVYLGAPVATPMDPRHRLVTTKYNPARTWTPENAVGIGGAYLCVYGMEGPGGYQFVGRTLQMWNRYNSTREFEPGKPWLLRFFDQIRFYPVPHDELMEMRRNFPHGLAGIKIEETTFDPVAYQSFLEDNRPSIEQFKRRQQQAFEQERQAWIENGHFNFESQEPEELKSETASQLLPGCDPVTSPVAGSMWKLLAKEESQVARDEVIAIVECMKMEISLKAPFDGTVKQVLISEGERVSSGQQLFGLVQN